jgi:hypothetical protein
MFLEYYASECSSECALNFAQECTPKGASECSLTCAPNFAPEYTPKGAPKCSSPAFVQQRSQMKKLF